MPRGKSICCLVMLTLCGCAGMGDRLPEFVRSGYWWKAAQIDDIGRRAKELEAQGELAMALEHDRLIERVAIDPTRARDEIRRLEGVIAQAVQSHYRQGLENLKAGEPAAARNHFLIALRLDPAFQPALRQIKAGFSPFPLMGYHTVAGDRPDTIAKKVFGITDNAFLVTWFNDLPDDARIAPDMLLILPKLEKKPAATPTEKQPPSPLDEARARLSEGDLEGAAALSGELDADDPAVQSLNQAIHLQQALIETEDGRLDEAGRSLAMVTDGFAGKAVAQEKLQSALRMRQQALDIDEARRLFDEKDFQGSLNLTTAVLTQAPDDIAARRLADEARYRLALDLVNHRQWQKARTVLASVADSHAPSTALKKKVTDQLHALAQMHYRNGVKYFINEDLQAAVDEWQKALECNPDLEKARENIDNARRIMQKIEKLP